MMVAENFPLAQRCLKSRRIPRNLAVYDECESDAMWALMGACQRFVPALGDFRPFACLSIHRAITYRLVVGRHRARWDERLAKWPRSVPGLPDNADARALDSECRQRVESLLDYVRPRTKAAVTWWVHGDRFEDVGRRLGITRERARQVVRGGIRRMRRAGCN